MAILTKTWNTGPLLSDSCGYIALSHTPFAKRIIVAFRGTYSAANTIVDLSAYPQPYVPYTGEGNGEEKPRCSNCTVHAGFMASWQNARSIVLPHLLITRKQHPDYKLVLVGHSLGGAVAALAGLEMQSRGWEPQVTTFGEPRVGNKAFVRFLDEKFDLVRPRSGDEEKNIRSGPHDQQLRFRRVTHINDPVPLLPLDELGYEMHGGEIFISKLDLPPSISDVEICVGNRDLLCIAGPEALRTLDQLNEVLSVNTGHVGSGNPMEQAVLSNERRHLLRMNSKDHNDGRQSSFDFLWSLIPSRYKVWELIFAHRDYFWRLGLCVPGGDPTRFRNILCYP